MADTAAATIIGPHGAKVLPSVEVDSYNLELKDDEGFLGDRASRKAFHAILENWRKPLRKLATDPFGDTPSDDLSRPKLDEIIKEGKDLEAIAVIQSAIEDYAQELSLVVRRFLKAKAWEGTERIAMGGGFRDSYIGELAIARANLILKAENIKVEMVPIHNDPSRDASSDNAQAPLVYSAKRCINLPSRNSDGGPHCAPAQMTPFLSSTIEPMALAGSPSSVEYIFTRLGRKRSRPRRRTTPLRWCWRSSPI